MPAFWEFHRRPRWFKPPLLVGIAAISGVFLYAYRNQRARDYDTIYNVLGPIISARYSVFYKDVRFQGCVPPCTIMTTIREAMKSKDLDNRRTTLTSGTNGYFFSYIISENTQSLDLNNHNIYYSQSIRDTSWYKKARLFVYLDGDDRLQTQDERRVSPAILSNVKLKYRRHYSITRYGNYPSAAGLLKQWQDTALSTFPTISKPQAEACLAMRLPNPIDYGSKTQKIDIDANTSCRVIRDFSYEKWRFVYMFDYEHDQPAYLPAPRR